MKKYFIAVFLLSGLMQGESEAVDVDMLLIVKEIKIISSKYSGISSCDSLSHSLINTKYFR